MDLDAPVAISNILCSLKACTHDRIELNLNTSIHYSSFTIVNLSFACSTKTVIDYYTYFRLCSSLSILLQTLYILS